MEIQERINLLKPMVLQAADEIEESEASNEVVEAWVTRFSLLGIVSDMHELEGGSICNSDTPEGELMRLEMHASLIDTTHKRNAHAAFPLWIGGARIFFGQEA